MKKYIIPGVVVVAFGIYLLLTRQQSTYIVSTPATTAGGAGANTVSPGAGAVPAGTPAGNNPPPAATPAATTPVVSAAAGAYKDGTYTGSVADAYFGNLQVAAVISGGKITDVQFPVYPNHSGHTAQISQTDLPILKQETIKSQNANVNIVSGATQTSQAYQQSLQVALAAAKI
jgi:uncharacterized protein with FMN-binding domain